MKRWIMLLALLCAVALSGCGQANLPPSEAQQEEWSETELYSQLFNLENRIEIELDMPEAELAKLQADHEHYSSLNSKSPIYRMADVTIRLTTADGVTHTYFLPQVGVRMKGNTSRRDFYSAEEGIYSHIHLKLDFQETFDDVSYYGEEAICWEEEARNVRQDRTFATLEKLELRWNKCADSTYLRELYAYEIYRDRGVPAPRMNLSTLRLSGDHMGVYTINEPVDKIFLEKWFPEEALGGDLYKCGWGNRGGASFTRLNSIGIENEDAGEFYAYDLKTNKKTSDHSALTSLIRSLNDGSVDREELDSLVDMESFLNYSAVSWLLGNPDDLRNNYNNFYLYFRKDNGKMLVIPYDFDRCLGITYEWNPSGDGCTQDDPFSTERLSVDWQDRSADRSQANPLILYTVAKSGLFTREYAQLLRELSQSKWVLPETFAAYYSVASSHYEGAVWPDRQMKNSLNEGYRFDMETISLDAPSGNLSFRQYINAKLITLRHYLTDPAYMEGDSPALPASAYIRAEFTDWQVDPAYAMALDRGLYSITLTLTQETRLKVYDSAVDSWYGTECLEPGSIPICGSDRSTNLVLQPGVYTLTFDPLTEMIQILGA